MGTFFRSFIFDIHEVRLWSQKVILICPWVPKEPALHQSLQSKNLCSRTKDRSYIFKPFDEVEVKDLSLAPRL